MTGTDPQQHARRLRLATISGMLLLHALTLAVWTGTWITGRVEESPLAVAGDAAAPALPALALCGLALAAALTIAGPVIRSVFAVLQVLLGFSIALSGGLVLADPATAAAPAVTARTGITGSEGVAELLEAASATALPMLAVVLGTASTALGVLLLLTGRRWPTRSSRFSAAGAEAAGGAGPIEEWDQLSDGADPTADPDDAGSEQTRRDDGPAGSAPPENTAR
jgi:hypothetical protein